MYSGMDKSMMKLIRITPLIKGMNEIHGKSCAQYVASVFTGSDTDDMPIGGCVIE